MVFALLDKNDLTIVVNYKYDKYPAENIKELKITINNTGEMYRGILPKHLNDHGYKKYELDERLIDYFSFSQTLNVDFDESNQLMYVNIDNLEFNDGKKYLGKIQIKMKKSFNIGFDIDEMNNMQILKQKLKTSIDYIFNIENKITDLEEENEKMKEKILLAEMKISNRYN